jgi:hypothetical protein
MAFATQGLIRWRTGVFIAGRELRGRTFIPGATESRSANGRPDSTYITTAETAAQDLLDNAALGAALVVYSVTHRQVELVQSRSVWGQWAVLRSRRD